MDILLLTVGRTTTPYISAGIEEYLRRISRYIPFSVECIADIKKTKALKAEQQKELEGKTILSRLLPSDHVVLLDERGKQMKSLEFADFLQKQMSSGKKRLVFVIGGPYGFSTEVYNRCNEMMSLSKMTFNHEMIRLFFIEQIYRANTILRGEPYHHE